MIEKVCDVFHGLSVAQVLVLTVQALAAVLAYGAACTEDQPRDGSQDVTPRGALVIETILTTCDLRHPGAVCRSNAECGVCDLAGVDVWFWRDPSSACLWVFTDAGTTPNTEPQGWDVCQSHGGPMDHRTRTP